MIVIFSDTKIDHALYINIWWVQEKKQKATSKVIVSCIIFIFEVNTKNLTSGSLESKSMGVATWKTPVHPLIASSKLPSSFRSAFHRVRCVDALGKSIKCFTFFTFSATHHNQTKISKNNKTFYVPVRLDVFVSDRKKVIS